MTIRIKHRRLSAFIGGCIMVLAATAATAGIIFLSSDDYTIGASGTVSVTNLPAWGGGGGTIPYYPASMLILFGDSPSGEVFRVQHIRGANTNTLLPVLDAGTNTVGWTNWIPLGRYWAITGDTFLLSSSSTNADIIYNRETAR